MRIRKKPNLDKRMSSCKKYLIPIQDECLNTKEAIKIAAYIDYEKLFNNNNPIELEVGCGMGQFACESAKNRPNINFIALERISNVIVVALERAMEYNCQNLKFINTSAECVTRYMPSHTIARIYLNFATPLPQKRAEKQRLTNVRFLEIYKEILTENGEIHLKTDNKDFFEYSKEELTKSGFLLKNITTDLHNSGFTNNIVTEHEKKFSEMGMPIYRLEAYQGEICQI
jgi:tRNA (guanine-N7-)-methyltransferase